MLQRLWLAGALALGLGSLAAADAVKPAPASVVDVAICLDTSNSMDGLIDAAKRKLWDIVNDLAKAKPTPKLRVALYSYGNDGYDPKTGWVRKEVDLTDDLDKVSEKLFGLRTNGGTEYVGRVCRDAIAQQKWSEDPKALKLIFVCGNEPATQDPEVQLKPLAETACRKGIVINTIYCGNVNHSEAKGWQDFATLAEGRFAAIDQNKSTVVIATPYDKELAKLMSDINTTFCFWGKDAPALRANQVAQDANAVNLGAGIAAGRALSKSGALYRFEEHDLVEKLKTDPKFDVKKIPDKELPEELKKLKPEEREKHLKDLLAKRADIQKKVAELSKKRESYIQAEVKKNPSKADQAFDQAVRGALREQAQKKGIEIQK